MIGDVSGFPAALPPGEQVLWQGRPDWRSLARRGFHLGKIAVYFAVLLAWYAESALTSYDTGAEMALAILRMTGVALLPLGLIALYAWISARTTLYTVTNRRVVLQIGIAMPITFNIPFVKIDAASLKHRGESCGDIALTLCRTERLAYFVLWPHAKPWRMAHAEPMLRCIPDAAAVAQILARALAASAQMPVPAASDARPTAPVDGHAAALV